MPDCSVISKQFDALSTGELDYRDLEAGIRHIGMYRAPRGVAAEQASA